MASFESRDILTSQILARVVASECQLIGIHPDSPDGCALAEILGRTMKANPMSESALAAFAQRITLHADLKIFTIH